MLKELLSISVVIYGEHDALCFMCTSLFQILVYGEQRKVCVCVCVFIFIADKI